MKCIEVKKNLDALLDDEIRFSEREKIGEHIKTCESCQTEFKNFQTISKSMKQSMPLIAPTYLDQKIIGAFENHHARKQTFETEEKIGWFGIPKFAFATAFLLLAIFSGLAFQLGRISASSVEIATSVNRENIQGLPNKKTEKVLTTKSDFDEKVGKESPEIKIIKVPVVKEKIVKVPVVKEKIVTKIVYVDKQNLMKKRKNNKLPKTTFALNNSVKEAEFSTQTNLKDFQPVTEIKPQIIKKEVK